MLVGSGTSGSKPSALNLTESDFQLLRDRAKPLVAVNLEGGNASYNVEAGEILDSVILKDRRNAAREAIKK